MLSAEFVDLPGADNNRSGRAVGDRKEHRYAVQVTWRGNLGDGTKSYGTKSYGAYSRGESAGE